MGRKPQTLIEVYHIGLNKSMDKKIHVRTLARQYGSSLYERIALSHDKNQVHRLAQEGNVITTSKDVLKDPYVLEFVGLDDKYGYSETDLENRLLDKFWE